MKVPDQRLEVSVVSRPITEIYEHPSPKVYRGVSGISPIFDDGDESHRQGIAGKLCGGHQMLIPNPTQALVCPVHIVFGADHDNPITGSCLFHEMGQVLSEPKVCSVRDCVDTVRPQINH